MLKRLAVPLPVQRPIMALSLEGSTVRIVVCRKGAITSWLSLPFNPRLLRDGLVEDPEGLATVIRNALARVGPLRARVIAAFSGARSVTRIITLPRLRGVGPEVVVPREARRLMGVTVENAYLFWARLERTETRERYYVLATPKAGIRAFLDTLRLSGLRPEKVDLKAVALARAIGQDQAIIANLEMDALDVVAVKDCIPTVISNVPLEGGIFETEELASIIVSEVQQCITYHNERNRPNIIGSSVAVFLCGGHPHIDQSLLTALGTQLGRPAQFPSSVIRHPPDFPPLQYMVNIGLVLKVT